MKRIISLALAALMIAALLVGCGGSSGSSDPTGKYLITKMNGQSIEDVVNAELESLGMSLDDYLSLAGVDSLGEMITIELKSDGTAVFNYSDEPMEGTWKQDGDKLAITIEGDTQEASLNGSELTLKDGSVEYVFKKK